MSKRRVSFGGVTFAPESKTGDSPMSGPTLPTVPTAESEKPAKMRKNNQIFENSEFNFGTADQRAENQQFVNEKVNQSSYL